MKNQKSLFRMVIMFFVHIIHSDRDVINRVSTQPIGT